MKFHIKRAYAAPAANDGLRVLVDRIWPRGLKKEEAKIDWWPKEIAPSTELRKWFSHDSEKWNEFENRYFKELDGRQELIGELLAKAGGGLTLVFAAKDEEHNNAVALKHYLEKR
jgi:uncharacterized protein YeaO (DUF488 family)